jgi:hypothetical protein
LPNYICRYRKYYPAESREEVWCEVPMHEGYLMIAGAMSLDGFLLFSGVVMADGGYVRQETDSIFSEAKKKP